MDNKALKHPLIVDAKEENTTYELVPTSGKTVQPVALLRLSVFAPVAPKERGKRDFELDASEELASLELAKSEGYSNIKIQGMKLSMSTDFKTWIGIIRSFSKYGFSTDEISLPFTEFAHFCGLKPNDINGRARMRMAESLTNLASVVLSFSDKTKMKFTATHLVHKAMFDVAKDEVVLQGDASLWELYRYDHKVLLGLKALSKLSRKEAAQSLYVYFESMPSDIPLFITMKRLRERLSMSSPVYRQNQIIRGALEDLQGIGYLNYNLVKKGREIQIQVFGRNAKLTAED